MKKRVKELRDLVIDEISLVDKGANQHATVTIAKRHGEEEEMSQYYDDGGNVVDIDSLSHGDVVYDETGDAYQFEADDFEYEMEEPAGVAKAFQRSEPEYGTLADDLRVELSKALTDSDRDEVIAKAFSQIDLIQKNAEAALESAEVERQMRLEREYVEVAKNYEVGVSPEELGPVLMRMAETMSHEDCEVIAKALDSATAVADQFLDEIGNRGGGANSDVFAQVESILDEQVAKGDAPREETVATFFETNPQAYDDYLAERRVR